MEILKQYINETVALMMDMAPYLLLGFIIAGVLHVFFPQDKVIKVMGKRNILSVFNGSLIGIPLPLCSCGVIPTGVSFFKNGASRSSSVSFLISTPQTGVDSILVTYSLLGLPFALIRPVVALFTGVFGGVVTQQVVKKDVSEHQPKTEVKKAKESFQKKFYRMFRYAFGDFLQDIQKWLVIGILLAGVIAVAVPDDFFAENIRSDFLGMLIVLAASVPLYVCATSSVPIAAVLIMKGLSPGAALVFLMAGPATNVATMTVIGKVMGKRTLFSYLTTIIAGALIFGFIINEFLPAHWFIIESFDHATGGGHLLPKWLKIVSAVILTALILNGFYQKYFRHRKMVETGTLKFNQMETKTVHVKGMTCNHCKMNVENAIKSIDGVKDAEADVSSGKVRIEGDKINEEKIAEAVKGVGYEYLGE